MSGAPLLDIRDLRIVPAEGRPILDGVSLSLRRGEILGVVGESGSGKSTLGLAALGHVRAGLRRTAGRARLDGEDLFALPAAQLRAVRGARLGYVAQSAPEAFNPALRLGAQIVEAAVFHGLMGAEQARARAVEACERLGLRAPEEMARRFVHQVSGGQAQRMMTAMAALGEPDLIVFDEPTTALDVTTQARVLAAIKALIRDSGAAALYITHDLAVVAQMASRICVLHAGRIVEDKPTEEILAHPAHERTRALWAAGGRRRPARPDPEGEALLEIRGLRAGYGRAEDTLRDVSLRIPRGRTTAVVGESGSGKTTLGRVVAGLLAPRGGALLLGGEPLPFPLRRRSRALRRRIQLAHQSAETALNPAQTARVILSRPLRLFHGLRGAALEARLRGLMDMVEMEPALLARRPGALSGGQKQRLALARALAAEPELLICDEVTSALDMAVRREILELLARIQAKTGVSYLFITHDMEAVRAIADRVIVMAGGRVAEAGGREEVLKRPRSEETRRLLEAAPRPEPGWLEKYMARGH